MRIGRVLSVAFIGLAMSAYPDAVANRCEWCDVKMLAPHAAGGESSPSGDVFWTQGEAETNKIDVMLVFDKTAKAWVEANGYGDCKTFAEEAVTELNAGLANTGIDAAFTFRLAAVKVTSAKFSGYTAARLATKAALLSGLTAKEKKLFDAVRAARDEAKADLTAFISDGFRGDAFGGGIMLTQQYWNDESLETFKDMAYCAVSISAIPNRYTLLHELGHLMGAGHADSISSILSPGPQLFDYSAGCYFRAGGVLYATVMTSEKDGFSDEEAIRLPFFSSPNYTMLVKDASGRLVDSGVKVGSASNDNTRTLLRTYPVVANFRVATPLGELPEDPRNITISARTPEGEISSGDVLAARVGVLFRIKTAASSSAKTTLSVRGLPSGLTFDATTGNLGGVPTKTGDYNVVIIAKNSRYSSSLSFRILVEAMPEWASGTYLGWVVWAGTPVYAKVIIKPNGKMKGAFKIGGKNRFFTSSRYSFEERGENGECVLGAEVSFDAGGIYAQKLTLRARKIDFADRSGSVLPCGVLAFDGLETDIRRDLWNDAAFSAAHVKKNRIVSVVESTGGDTGLGNGDYLKFMLSADGCGRYAGRIANVKVSGTSQFVRLGAEAGSTSVELAKMPIIVTPRAGTALPRGYAREAFFRFAVNGSGNVAGLKLTHLETVPAK